MNVYRVTIRPEAGPNKVKQVTAQSPELAAMIVLHSKSDFEINAIQVDDLGPGTRIR